VGQGLSIASHDGKALVIQRNSHGIIRVYSSQLAPEDSPISTDIKQVKKDCLELFKGWDQKLLNFISQADENEIPPAWKIYAADPDYRREFKLGAELLGDANKCMSPFAGEVRSNKGSHSYSFSFPSPRSYPEIEQFR